MTYQSSFPPIDIPETDLWTLLFEREDLPFADTKAIFTSAHTGRSQTYAGLRQAALAFGRGLRARWSWRKGDVLALYTPNSVDTAGVTMGALWAGAVVCPANPLYTVDELARQLSDSRAAALVTQPAYLASARQAASRAGLPEDRILLLGEQRDDSTGKFAHWTDLLHDNTSTHHIPPTRPQLDPGADLAFLVYSSGTTGLPKGVCLTHRNMAATLLQFGSVDGRTFHPDGGFGGASGRGDVQLGILPLFHIYGLLCAVLAPLRLGLEVVLLEDRFDLATALAALERHRCAFAYVPPPVVLALAKDPLVARHDLSSLKMLHSGAAPLTRALTEAVWGRLAVPVKQGFGLSETGGVTHVQSWDEWGKFMGSVGKLVPNMEARIVVGDDGEPVAEGEPGELWLRGPNVFVGYYGQPEKTREALTPDGWFKTGDVFRRDRWGNYFCVDRLKELIKYNGFPVPPAELEGLLVGHEEVVDVCVIGVEDEERATEVPRAYVVLKAGVEATEAKALELAGWLARRVAPHKRLRGGVRFVAQVPKSPSGKILRRVMREQAGREQARREDRATGPKL